MNILLGVTGSVATVLLKKIVESLQQKGRNEVRVIFTERSKYFVDLSKTTFTTYDDDDEWPVGGYIKGQEILHIELRKWAEVMVIAPLSANTMAKVVHGLCDNLLTSVVRAWDFNKPIILCPAMNTYMWDSSITQEQLFILERRRYYICQPQSKTLACGDTGIGAMCEIKDILEKIILATEPPF